MITSPGFGGGAWEECKDIWAAQQGVWEHLPGGATQYMEVGSTCSYFLEPFTRQLVGRVLSNAISENNLIRLTCIHNHSQCMFYFPQKNKPINLCLDLMSSLDWLAKCPMIWFWIVIPSEHNTTLINNLRQLLVCLDLVRISITLLHPATYGPLFPHHLLGLQHLI